MASIRNNIGDDIESLTGRKQLQFQISEHSVLAVELGLDNSTSVMSVLSLSRGETIFLCTLNYAWEAARL